MTTHMTDWWWAPGLVLLATASAPAFAQDDELPEGTPSDAQPAEVEGTPAFDFDVNSVLVASFLADQPFLEPEAERVRKLVEKALGASYVVVGMSEVPAFTDYSAEIYLRSCPQGQYIGCVFVVGGRAETDWTIGGRVGAVEGGYKVDLSFIDVDEAKLVLEFDVVLDGSNDAEFQEGVTRIMDALVAGNVQDLDIRGDPEAQRAAEKEAKAREDAAKRFAADSVYEDLGDDVERGTVGEDAYVGGAGDDLEEPEAASAGRTGGRVTFEDLEEMEGKGGLTPWERAGLTKGQYRLYRNSGKKLRDFKARLQGRKGEVIVRASLGVSHGPWGQAHATGFLLQPGADPGKPPQADDIQSQSAMQLQATMLSYGGQLEVGGGVTRWMEILAYGGLMSSPYSWNLFAESPSVEVDIPDPCSGARGTGCTGGSAWYAGAKIGFVPMPAYPARPTLHVGGAWWQGTAIGKKVDLAGIPALYASKMPANNMILATIEPGFEVNAGKMVTIFARAQIDIPLAGRYFQYNGSGSWPAYSREAQLVKPFYTKGGMFAFDGDHVVPGRTIGIGANVGVTFRFRVAGLR
jgi:hypothetical protein